MSQFDVNGLIAQNGVSITPSNTEILNLDGFYIDADSTVQLEFLKRDGTAGNTILMTLKAGYHPLRCRRILATGTTLGSHLIGLLG